MTLCKWHQELKCKWCRKFYSTSRYYESKGIKSLIVYCVKLTHYKTKETFFKVGVTSTSVEERFLVDSERFMVQVINTKVLPTRRALALENEVLIRVKQQNRDYKPKARISGCTECFR